MDEPDKEKWLKIVLAQYGLFGTIAGLEVTALAIYVSFAKIAFSATEKVFFSITAFCLFAEVVLILWMINQERKVAFNDENMSNFKKKERNYRNSLITIMSITWGLILFLLTLRIWS